MDALVNEAQISYETLSNYSSADFKDLCENYSVTVTVLDVITFNTYKSLIAELKDVYDQETFPISKRQYVETRLNRELSNEEFTAMLIMYDHYYMLADYYETQPFIQMTFDELLLEFKNRLSFEPIGEDLTQLQLAYDIILSLKTLAKMRFLFIYQLFSSIFFELLIS